MILLDTDIVSLLFAQHSRVVSRFRKSEETVGITIITRIEMLEGRFAFLMKAEDPAKLLRARRLLSQTENDLSTLPLADLDDAAAEEFGKLREDKKLKKIGRGDILIASIALAQRATLVTRNLKHFRLVPGLKVENWAD